MAEGVLFNIADGIKNKLISLATQEAALWWGLNDQLRKLEGTITRIKTVLNDAEEKGHKQSNEVKNWLGKLQEAVFDAEDLLDDFSTEDLRKQLIPGSGLCKEVCVFFSGSNQFVYGLIMAHKVKALRERLDEIDADSKKYNFEVRDEERASLTSVREKTISFEPEIVIGRDADKEAIVSFLLNSDYEENVSVISIVGVGGMGKTTLAQHVFNDEQVKENFGESRLWVCVSGGVDVRKILKEAAGVKGDSDEIGYLKKVLEDKIQNKKYLLVLDDLWDVEDGQKDGERWDTLKQLLPRDARGSKILITTRSGRIAEYTSRIPGHVLNGLSEEASWHLFVKKAFPLGQESNHVENEKIKKEIVERCFGIPLVIKSIARLMCLNLKNRSHWLSFVKQELPFRVRNDDNIIQTLKLSYDPLPSYMKQCFSYCSLLPKGHRIDVKSLLQLWVAQGFISRASNLGDCDLEMAALECFENLMWRSFFHDVISDSLGNILSCKMHDFMHDLATKVAGYESTKLERGGNRISDLTRHVSIFDMELNLSQQYPIPLSSSNRLRTLMMLGGKWNEDAWESICQAFRCLRVLDLHGLGIDKVSPSIEKLKLLKYLDLSFNEMEALPNSIINLVNLQVLKLNGCEKLKELPRDINKLIKLMHLDVGCSVNGDLCKNLECMPCGIGQLTCLQTLSCFVIGSVSEVVGGLDELSRLNELRGRLEIRVKGYERNSCMLEFEGANILIEKKHLQSFTISWDNIQDDSDFWNKMLQSLEPNLYLQELNVRRHGGMRFPSWLSHLTNLVRIRLEICSCNIPPLHEISTLEELCIGSMYNLEYIDSDSEGVGAGRGVSTFFPSLKKLEIRDCPRLKGWWKKSSDESTTTTTDQQEELSFPRLSSLKILSCPYLTSMPLFPSLDDVLGLDTTSSVPLQQTMKMKGWKSPLSSVSSSSSSSSSFMNRPLSKLKKLFICKLTDSESVPEEDGLQYRSSLPWPSLSEINALKDLESLPEDLLQNLSSLQRLTIRDCRRLKSLPLPDQGMHSLQILSVGFCKELRSLSKSQSQWIPYLPSLQELDICKCSEELIGRLREGKEDLEYWRYINHIPYIRIDFHYIQKDGRYVKDPSF